MVPQEYIPSNRPSAHTNFRLGDWICRIRQCAAHNFRRNLNCIRCGCPRCPVTDGNNDDTLQSPTSSAYGLPQSFSSTYDSPTAPIAAKGVSSHPLLTPSGRAFASDGKVQNISSDPLAPCIMYWPDNEPFPEQGQIRPICPMGVPHPPIRNTGNSGPISHQPGDWICLKCHYLNWRRRKVCQTCLPFAEGNSDTVSATLQAERIALLTSALAQTGLGSPGAVPVPSPRRLHTVGNLRSTTHPSSRSLVTSPPPQSELGRNFGRGPPIYPQCAHLVRPTTDANLVDTFPPAPLLPSFLQDIVGCREFSPASPSSAIASFEGNEDSLSTFSGAESGAASPFASFWRLDEEEIKYWSVFPRSIRQEVMGSITDGRNNTSEHLRVTVFSR
ncbi:hypothetical protein B0H13DRAFT_1602847 [Mycena leptocephala]|nr:hypothetical protein B0H13DRAFT_1602847 [Mycena leptocephala]